MEETLRMIGVWIRKRWGGGLVKRLREMQRDGEEERGRLCMREGDEERNGRKDEK